jgi:nickel/cobalt transporter (NicO) family protein
MIRWRYAARLATVAGAAGVLLIGPGVVAASAHPLGNFTVNRYTGILVAPDHVLLDHVFDFAEIPTAQFGDQTNDLPALAARECHSAQKDLSVVVGGQQLTLRVLTQRRNSGMARQGSLF